MKKDNYIATILLFVFSFVFVHNIIPHHHHDNISEVTKHEHEHQHEHHHDKKEQDHPNEKDEPIHSLSHPTHILASTEFIFSSANNFQKIQDNNPFLRITKLVTRNKTVSVKRKPPNYIFAVPLQLFDSTLSLRGPPIFTI